MTVGQGGSVNENRTKLQKAALDAILSGKDVYIAGEEGVGKTSVLKEAAETLSDSKQVLVVAATAMAAEAIGGSTLHLSLIHISEPTRP